MAGIAKGAFMKTNSELQRKILAELDWDPRLDASQVGVACSSEGVVTLTGHVGTYADRISAEQLTWHIGGVKAVANDLEVKLSAASRRTDTDVAGAAVRALEWDVAVPHEQIKVTVGWVALAGEVEWQFQRAAAEQAIRQLVGVRGVGNQIMLKPRVTADDVKGRIEAAFKRNAELEARRVQVDVQDRRVVLRGKVHSWAERQEAERAAWAAPGVAHVEDNLAIGV